MQRPEFTTLRFVQDIYNIALEIEQDLKCKTYLEAAVIALKGGSLNLIEGVLKEYALDEILRDRE